MSQFVKGKSGNPGGRPKDVMRISELARSYSEHAIQVIVDCLADDDPNVRIKAANSLLDRGLGKPSMAIKSEAEDQRIVVKIMKFGDAENGLL